MVVVVVLPLPVSYTPPRILVESSSSPHFIHKVHLQSTISPPPVLLQSPPVQSTPHGLLMDSSQSPHGVLMESTWSGLEVDLAKFKEVSRWSPGGVHVES